MLGRRSKGFADLAVQDLEAVLARVSNEADRIAKLADEGVTELMTLAGNTDPLDISAMTAVWMGIVDSLMRWWVEHPDESAAAMTARSGRLLTAILGGAQ